MIRPIAWLLCIFALLVPAKVLAVDVQAGPYKLGLSTDPAVIPVGQAKLNILLTDSKGTPVSGATVRVFAQMPGMPMGEREQLAVPVGSAGHYSAPVSFGMAGGYDARISITASQGAATVTTVLQTGQDASGGTTGLPWAQVLVGLLALGIVGLVLVRMRRVGMRPNLSGVFSLTFVGSALFIAVVLAVAVWAVNTLRRPGSMTPLAAQGMEMSTPAPAGTTPVTLAAVRRGSVRNTVHYSGQAVGYVEQDVFARVTGTLIYMPLYPGDHVRRGQVLARLDVSQLAPQVAEKQAMTEAARQGVGSAEADYRASQAMVDQAVAEHGQFSAAIGEAESEVVAAKEGRSAMEAQVTSAQADEQDMRARVRSAQADADYWIQELARMNQLLKAGAVSRDEFQKSQAEAKKADANVQQMKEEVRSAQAKVRAAQASVRQADAAVAASQRKLAQAHNELQIHHAHVASATATAASSRQKIAQAVAGVRQAQAGLASAAAAQDYATITSPIDGVVTQRNITVGTLVQPGSSILRVSQVAPIRLQANVPVSDLEKIVVGAAVSIHSPGDKGGLLQARVTTVSPSVDAGARTGIVEVVVPNNEQRFLPGQYVSMEIATGQNDRAILVPNEALQAGSGDDPSKPGATVWVADPVSGQAGRYSVRQVSVQTGSSDGKNTAVLSGLEDGQKVVTSGFINLHEGAAVTDEQPSAATSEAAGTPITVRITESGFDPATIHIPAGRPARVIFLRTTDKTCGLAVSFPELGITKDLPLNQPVTIDLGSPKKALNFRCGMNMLKGQVVVQ